MFGDAADMRNENCPTWDRDRQVCLDEEGSILSKKEALQEWEDMRQAAQASNNGDYIEERRDSTLSHVHAEWKRTPGPYVP